MTFWRWRVVSLSSYGSPIPLTLFHGIRCCPLHRYRALRPSHFSSLLFFFVFLYVYSENLGLTISLYF
jgi:hypothetical protein